MAKAKSIIPVERIAAQIYLIRRRAMRIYNPCDSWPAANNSDNWKKRLSGAPALLMGNTGVRASGRMERAVH